MKLYVIRHGQTEKNRKQLIADIEEDINENGILQAVKAGEQLRKLKIDLIVCSPALRTRHTLKLLNMDLKIPIILDERLIERDMGIYVNEKFENLNWKTFWNYYDNEYKSLESMKSVYARVSNLLNELKEKYKEKNILLVTHGGVARAIYWYAKGIPADGNVPIEIKNGKVIEYEI